MTSLSPSCCFKNSTTNFRRHRRRGGGATAAFAVVAATVVAVVVVVVISAAATTTTTALSSTSTVQAFSTPFISGGRGGGGGRGGSGSGIRNSHPSTTTTLFYRDDKAHGSSSSSSFVEELDKRAAAAAAPSFSSSGTYDDDENDDDDDQQMANTIEVDAELLRKSVFGVDNNHHNNQQQQHQQNKNPSSSPSTTADTKTNYHAFYNDAVFDVPAVEVETTVEANQEEDEESQRHVRVQQSFFEVGSDVLNTKPHDLMYQQYPPPPSSAKDHQHIIDPATAGPQSIWDAQATTIKTVQGGSLKTWSLKASNSPNVQILLQQPEGQPVQATVDLWQGPDYVPISIGMYSENGLKFPLTALMPTPSSWMSGIGYSMGVRNTGPLAYPMRAAVVAGSSKCGSGGGGGNTNGQDGNFDENPAVKLHRIGTRTTIDGGSGVRSYPQRPAVSSVQILLQTDGRPLHARIELSQGVNHIRQVLEIYSENGSDYPFFGVLETPGETTPSMIRVVNVGDVTFPMTACVEPYLLIDNEDEGEAEMKQKQNDVLTKVRVFPQSQEESSNSDHQQRKAHRYSFHTSSSTNASATPKAPTASAAATHKFAFPGISSEGQVKRDHDEDEDLHATPPGFFFVNQ